MTVTAPPSTPANVVELGRVVDINRHAPPRSKALDSTGKALESSERQVAADLAEFEKQIDEARHAKVVADWDIGAQLTIIFERDLWRSANNGEHKSFVAYAQARFDLGKDMAQAYLRIAKTFTREQAAELSITQLWHLARVRDDGEREKLIADVRAGKFETTRELAAAVKAKRAEMGLATERGGFEGTVLLSARLKPGIVTVGEAKVGTTGNATFSLDLGGHTLQWVYSPKTGRVQVKFVPAVTSPSE